MPPKRVQGKLGLVRSPGERLAHGRYFEVIYGATWLIVYSSWATVRLYRSEGLIDTHEIHRDFNKIPNEEAVCMQLLYDSQRGNIYLDIIGRTSLHFSLKLRATGAFGSRSSTVSSRSSSVGNAV